MKSNWQNKIQQYEAAAPEAAWKNIARMLTEEENAGSNLATRLSAMEVTPPATAQKNIFALLDAQQPFEQKLYNYEATPPETAWPNIASELNKGETKIVSFESHKRKAVYLRAAAAIAVIALLSISVWFFSQQSSSMEEISSVTPKKQQNTPVTPAITETQPEVSVAAQKENVAANRQTKPQVDVEKTNPVALQPVYVQADDEQPLAQNPANGVKEKLQTATGETPENIAAVDANGSYMMIAGPDGEMVRVSTKFSKLVNYFTNQNPALQENIDVIISESAKWRNTFAVWREKMTNNNVAPSFTNFMDIIELSNILEKE